MIPWDYILVRFGTLIYFHVVGDDTLELQATCPSASEGRRVATALSDLFGIPVRTDPPEHL